MKYAFFKRQQGIALFLALFHAALSPLSQAATTDLASEPLANVAGTVAVKPNIMFLLDDSGSMMQQYTPDYVSERWGEQAASDMHCRNSADTQVRVTPGLVNTDANGSRDLCVLGDPPYMSPDFNKQYYNPAISYTPPVDYLGNSYQSQTSANTAGWTAVKTDGFNVQNLDQFENALTTVNITAGIPERKWCDTAAGVTCVTNTGDYSYPDATYKYNFDAGANDNRYLAGAPYYFSISAGEYCDTEDLKNCVYVLKGTAAPAGFPFPAKVRWCNSAANANVLPPATPAVNSCQAKKTGSFQYARFSPYAPSATAYGTIQIGSSGSTDSVAITEVRVGAVVVTNGTVTAASGTLSSANRAAFATALAASITAKVSAPEYLACAGAACAGPLGVTLADDTVGIYPAVAAGSYPPISVVPTSTGISPAYGVVTVTNSGSGGSKTTGITVNGVEIQNGGLANFGSNSTTSRTNAANAIAARINAYANATPWEYTAATNVAGTNCNAANKVCVYAPASAGALPNTFPIKVTTSGGGGISLSTLDMAGGVSRYIPTNVTAIGSASTFTRTDIKPGETYPRAGTRTDCVTNASYCTYDEEMTNYANWYAYYRTRMQMMKSSVGQAFLSMNSDYRAGFNTINQTDVTGSSNSRYLAIGDYDTTQKQNWYTKLYAQNASGSTPLRTAVGRIGRLYEGTIAGAQNPIQYSCQQNFTIVTTDGYWNQSFTGYGDQDNAENDARFCTRANGCYDGNLGGGSANSLADVALYYYWRDLRTGNCNSGYLGADICTNNVPTSTRDPNPGQHMTTFTLGLGVDGVMAFREDYETATAGDFYKIKTGNNTCTWTAAGATCNWPVPAADTETAVDDLWHAAVNGHGTYFSAKDPASLSRGLANALNNLKMKNGAAAASATSTPNVTLEDNDIFSATFRTVKWDGELIAQKIDTDTGKVLPAQTWGAQGLLDAKVADSSDTRTIYMLDTASTVLKDFSWASLTATEQDFFRNKCIGAAQLSQCVTLDAAQKALANDGQKMVNFVRGQQEMEVAGIYRNREHVLGDIASAKPAYVRSPRRDYGDAGYGAYKAAQASRQAMVYAGANDGMLHAINATTGQESWGYVPRMVMPNLYKLASENYGTAHEFFVDGSPETGDVYIGGQWRTILVGGLNKGGRGYYALDVTNPASPIALWEFCADSSMCAISDSDIGYTYGDPVITKRPSDGRWVVLVTSGYNNVSPGDGKGYLYVLDAATGAILDKIGTGAGSTATPSGLAKITARAENANTDNTGTTVFGGDVLGNLWRFDMTANTVVKLASLTDYQGTAQPITTSPDVGKCNSTPMVFVGTGKYLGVSDLTDTQRQTIYGIKDSSTPLGAVRSNNMVQQSFSPVGGGYTLSNNAVDLAAKNGWLADLDQNLGERINLDPSLVLGTLVFVSNQPTTISACSTGGVSYLYQLDYCTGSYLAAAANQVAGKKLFDSISVGFIVIRLPGGGFKGIFTPAGGGQETSDITAGGKGKPRRVSWREFVK